LQECVSSAFEYGHSAFSTKLKKTSARHLVDAVRVINSPKSTLESLRKMLPMKSLNVVHLSDLHLKSDETGRFNQSLIINALKVDLQKRIDSSLRPDCIIFSGDIVNDGDDLDAIEEAVRVISEIAESAGLDRSRVFLCPGNHDASRSVVGPAIPHINEMRQSSNSVEAMNKLAKYAGFVNHVEKAFKNFELVRSNFGSQYTAYTDAICHQYYVRDLNLSIISLNTASLTGCGLTKDVSDVRAIFLPEMTLVNALRRVPDGAKVLIFGHHPLSWMSESVERIIRSVLMNESAIYLSGHMHEALPFTLSNSGGACTFVQSGALYASRDWWNGYAIISIVLGQPHYKFTYRKWHEARREFGVASDLNDEGVVHTSAEAKIFWQTVTPRINLKSLNAWRSTSLSAFQTDEFGTEFETMCASGTFVEPEFEKDVYVEIDGQLEKANISQTVLLKDAIKDHENLIIVAHSESGKTTLIRNWAKALADRPIPSPDWSIPVALRFSELKSFVKGIENIVKQKLPDLPSDISSEDLLREGHITIFVDDMEIREGKHKIAFDDFVKKYPSCRYVIFTGTVYLQGAGIAPVIVPGVPFSHLRLKQLKNSQLLTLIESHGTTDPAQADRLLQRMKQEAASLNVPITPVTGTFLIQIYTEDASQPLINRANLIERYVEISLEKFAPQELLPSTFDFHNKSDLLSYIAEHMCRFDVSELPELQFINLIVEYLSEYGLRFSSIDIIDYFVRARILTRSGRFISFRLNAFMEYFAARRMADNAAFCEWIFENERYLQFCNEIAFYAAISRRDESRLSTVFERFKSESEGVWQGFPDEIKDGSFIENFVLPSPKADEAEIFELGDRIVKGVISQDERRAVLDGDDDLLFQRQALPRRKTALDPGAKWLAQLSLLGEMLKNMDFVPSSFKKEVLKHVIQGWLQFTALSMGLVPDLAKERRMTLAGINYIVLFPKMDVAELARRIFMYIPISTAKMATYHLGSEKLRVQLEEGIGSDDNTMSKGQQFMRATILAQLGVGRLDRVIKKVEPIFRETGFLNSVFIRMLSEIVVRFRLPDTELHEIRSVVGRSIASLEGKKGYKAAQRTGQVIESLSARRLVLGPKKEGE